MRNDLSIRRKSTPDPCFAVAGCLLAALLVPASSRAERLPGNADEVVQYTIAVSLDASAHKLEGRQRLVWRNPSADPVTDLWFHLYLNAFKNSQSTFFRESGGQLRGDQMEKDGWGWIDVTSMRLGEVDLRPGLRFEHPDDDNADDQTVARVALPEPVPPGGAVTLDITFTAQLPRVFARTGYKDTFHLVAQWFPKIAVYEPAGRRGRTAGGWNAHQFHANSEFYADFGRFDVEITVPAGYVVGATGRRTAERRGNGTLTYTYSERNIHDFAWTADTNFVEVRRTFSAANDVTADEYRRIAQLLGRTEDEVRLRDVEILVLVQPPHRPQADRYVRAAVEALKWFGLLYGRYPYETLTVVDPAPGGGGAGGMEYPTFITAGTTALFNRWPFHRIRAPEEVTIHEFGHQYWYGMVANNEFEEAWLDEGLNTYSTARAMEFGYGPGAKLMEFLGLSLDDEQSWRMQNTFQGTFDRVRQPAWTYGAGGYSFYSYTKPGLLLRTLEHHVGEQTMARIMRTYHERWRFKHPASEDFYAVANEVSGQDLSWYFRQAVEDTESLDYEVSRASSVPTPAWRGFFDEASGRTLVTEEDASKTESDDGRARSYMTTVVVKRRGGFVFPVDVGFKFEGKPLERVRWDGRDRWTRYRFERPERLEWVDVDPDRKVLLDANWMNNGRRIEPDGRPAAHWAARLLFWVQNLLATVGW
jgi:hypothetical protein